MAHKEQKQFCRWVKKKHRGYFSGTIVVDVGSLDINGSNRYLFGSFLTPSMYLGIDLIAGKNVDFVGRAHELLPSIRFMIARRKLYNPKFHGFTDNAPNVVISTECLEHDRSWISTMCAMYESLTSGGLLVITCAAPGRLEHGTTKNDGWCSPATNDYYRNISVEDFAEVLPPSLFSEYYLVHDKRNNDIFFYGIKV
jgi:hypothetical protein